MRGDDVVQQFGDSANNGKFRAPLSEMSLLSVVLRPYNNHARAFKCHWGDVIAPYD